MKDALTEAIEETLKPRVQDALSALLHALGFGAMGRAVLTEHSPDRLRRYAQVIAKQEATSSEVRNGLRKLRLI